MSGRRKEDKELWEQVKKTVKPLLANRADFLQTPVTELNPKKSVGSPVKRKPVSVKPQGREKPKMSFVPAASANRIDPAIARRIAKGRINIEGKLDLHGMNQSEAYQELSYFLQDAHQLGKRTVLVIPGKGYLGEGILRNAVPRWLAEPFFRKLVSGYEQAHIMHGGAGALYVRLRANPRGELL